MVSILSLREVREHYYHLPKSKQESKVFGQETVAQWIERTGKKPEQIKPGTTNWTPDSKKRGQR